MSYDPDVPSTWELRTGEEEEPDWAEEIRRLRKARVDRSRRELGDVGDRTEPPAGDDESE